MKNGSDLKRCSCRMCRWGMHTKRGSYLVQKVRRAHRHKIKQLLKTGRFDEISEKIGLPYTD